MIKSKRLTKFKEIEHFFFNRLSGKSKGIYKSLNCGSGSSDNKKNILKNLALVEKKIRSGLNKIVLLNQIHSNKFYYIDKTSKLNHKFYDFFYNSSICTLPSSMNCRNSFIFFIKH